MSDLFQKETKSKNDLRNLPLSVRMRPQALDEFSGQEHIIGQGKLLRRAIFADRLNSIILYGPPGCGKTTLGLIISNITKSHFTRINAVDSSVEEMRKIISAARNRKETSGQKTILFIDEIHRFNKAQQDILMPDVEDANLILIGATVHNPFFSIISALISRSLVFELKPLKDKDILSVLKRALEDKERGLGNFNIKASEEALKFLSQACDGDARRALNALEVAALTTEKDKDGVINIDLAVTQESIQKKAVSYDRDEDGHYDTVSAFIKSMRGSDPDAALYWMAKMLYAGEDPRFIARRICICAAEDVGNADPQALVVANAALQIAEFVGLPEARIPLAQACVYIASAPKSNAAYLGIDEAMHDVANEKLEEVPLHLKDTNYKGSEKLGHGKDYKYAHDFKDHYVQQDYGGKKKKYYRPTDIGFEANIKKRLDSLKSP